MMSVFVSSLAIGCIHLAFTLCGGVAKGVVEVSPAQRRDDRIGQPEQSHIHACTERNQHESRQDVTPFEATPKSP